MESLVYENSPLADYLQGILPCSMHVRWILMRICLGEGEKDENCPVDEANSERNSGDTAANFAPRGASKFQQRVRNKLPKPLVLQNARHVVVIANLYDACSVWCIRQRLPARVLTRRFFLVYPERAPRKQ